MAPDAHNSAGVAVDDNSVAAVAEPGANGGVVGGVPVSSGAVCCLKQGLHLRLHQLPTQPQMQHYGHLWRKLSSLAMILPAQAEALQPADK